MSVPAEALKGAIQPGRYTGEELPNEAYHASEGISSSGIKKLLQSPLHYWEHYLNPEREKTEPTAAMQLGSAVHTLVLEPPKFDLEYAVQPEGINKRTNAGKAEFAAFEAASKGKTILTPAQHKTAEAMARSVRSNPRVRDILAEGVPENSLYWIDQETGVLCKIRPDWWSSLMIDDLKTTQDASVDGFMRAIANFGYHISAAMYLDGIRQVYGEELPFVFTCVEKEPPFAAASHRISDAALAEGYKRYRSALQTYAKCIERGTERKHWPGYPLDILTIELPRWAYAR